MRPVRWFTRFQAERRLGVVALLLAAAAPAPAVQEIPVDVCVYGGTSGGVVAAAQAARMGKTVALVVVGNHLGGMSSSGLGWTDIGHVGNGYIQGVSREFYTRIGQKYGQGTKFTFEPHVAEAVFRDLIQEAGVSVHTNLHLVAVTKEGPRIISATMNNGTLFRAKVFVDASYEGDLMAAAGVSYIVGRESTSQYGESLNGTRVPNGDFTTLGIDPYVMPGNPASGLLPLIQPGSPGTPGEADQRVQAYNFRLCLTTVSTNKLPITAPANYDPEQYELLARYIEARVAQGSTPSLSSLITIESMPNGKTDINNRGPLSTDFVGESAAFVESDFATRQQLWQAHKDYMQGFLHFLATDLRVPQSLRNSMLSYGLCQDEFADNGGWPYELYVREGRRMISDYVMTQSNVFNQVLVPDAVGMAGYFTDSHYCQRVVVDGVIRNEGDARGDITEPYPISYRAIVPKPSECSNLIVPWSLSASHTAFSSIRMEPVFMILGQAAGTAAAFAIDEGVAVQGISIPKLQAQLIADGQALGTAGGTTGDNEAVSLLLDFGPTAVATTLDRINSPGHALGGLSITQTNWNSGLMADAAGGLVYSDGTAATGVSVAMGRSAAGGPSINFDDNGFISSNPLGGSQSSGVYGGNSPAKDGFYGGSGGNALAVGVRVNGLAAGTYTVFVAARNTSTQFEAPERIHATNGPSAATYVFTNSPSVLETNSSPAPTSAFIQGDNCSHIVVTLEAGDALFLAAAGVGSEVRGFLNALEIVPGLPVMQSNLPVVKVWSSDSSASRLGLAPGGFTVSRTGDTGASLTVNLALGGSAANGQDYELLSSSVLLPAGVAATNIPVIPMPAQQPVGDRTVTIQLVPSTTYRSGSLTSTVVTIEDVPLSGWRYQYFGNEATNPVIAGDLANPTGDGIPNLVKYALGLVPTNYFPGSILSPEASFDGAFAVSFARPDPPPPGIAYALEASLDIAPWAGGETLALDGIEYVSNGTAKVTYRTMDGVASAPAKFVRLRVTPN